jgi:protein-S-isoprenylcysteine O-methyltransferase Ste14
VAVRIIPRDGPVSAILDGDLPETALWILWAAWFVTWWIAALWSDRSVHRPGLLREMKYRAFTIAGVILLFPVSRLPVPARLTLWHARDAVAWTLFAVAGVGLAFSWWARLHLGRLWSSNVTRKSSHHVIDTGPYGLVRHPIYTGVTLAALATALMRGTVPALAGFGLLTLGWYIKARLEEAFLREQIGAEAYDAYARRVPMLVPFI